MTTESEGTTPFSLYDAYETDVSAEENGKWFKDFLGPGSGCDIKIRRTNAQIVDKARQRILTANRKLLVKGKFDADVEKRIQRELIATAIIVDWRGIVHRDGTEIKFDKESALKVLEDLPNFQRDVWTIADSMNAFLAETQEEVAGN